MGLLDERFIDDLKDRVDLVSYIDKAVKLKKSGKNYSACCPFHDEKTPSFTVNPVKQHYYCFGCGAGGDVINWLKDYERLTFRDAVERLANDVGVEVPKDAQAKPKTEAQLAVPDALHFAASFFYKNMCSPNFSDFQNYLKGRGISGETAKRFRLGAVGSGNQLMHAWKALDGNVDGEAAVAAMHMYHAMHECGLVKRADDQSIRDFFFNRLMFPVRNYQGRVVGFGGRVLDDSKPKYINSIESDAFKKERVLYGLYEALQHDKKPERFLVVEGYMDVVALSEHGIHNAIACMGTAFGEHHAKQAFRLVDEIVFCFDGDSAGQNAAERSLQAVAPYIAAGKSVKFAFMPDGYDPDSLCKDEGVEAFNALLDEAVSPEEMIVIWSQRGIDVESLTGKNKQVARLQEFLALFEVSPYKVLLTKHLAKAVGLTVKQLELPRTPSETGAKNNGGEGEPLSEAFMQRYFLVEGSTCVFDKHADNVLKKSEFVAQVGKVRAALWFEADEKQSVTETEAWGVDVENPLERYVYLYPTEEVWDLKKRITVPAKALRIALADRYNWWMFSRERLQIDHDCLVFDPTHSVDEKEGYINKFSGLELEPFDKQHCEDTEYAGCKAILGLVKHLCNNDVAAINWVLSWLAYPLQHVGAKMDTSLLFHGEIEGSGKTLLFSKIVGRIYGRYFGEFGQAQLDSSWNSWQGERLFGVFDEVVGKKDKYSGIGRLKQMVTSEKVVIERKFRESQIESNFMNTVFLANDDLPFPISPFDRRWFVMWPQGVLTPDQQRAIDAEMEGDGIAIFYQFLLNYSLNGFGPRTKPPVNADKQRLIEFGMPGWEVFFREWSGGELGAPYMSCLAMDLYEVYLAWCNQAHYRGMNRNHFILNLKKRVGHKKLRYREYKEGSKLCQRWFFIVSDAAGDAVPKEKPDQSVEDWATFSVTDFRQKAGMSDFYSPGREDAA